MDLARYLEETADLLRQSANGDLAAAMDRAISLVAAALNSRRPVLVAGNGGSMADAQHIAGELVARFKLERPGLPVIALGSNGATLTAWANDYDYTSAFAREVEAFGQPGGVFIGISTSGNSENIIAAANRARNIGMDVIAMTGQSGGRLATIADVIIAPPSSDTPRIQEVHTALYHFLCQHVEIKAQ